MFIENKYTKCYYNIINKHKNQILLEYSEKHHIIPKSLGGSNNKENIVRLPYKAHFICHWLLTKMVIIELRHKMYFAFYCMSVINKFQERSLTSRQFEICKIFNKKEKNIKKTKSINKGKVTVKDKSGNFLSVDVNDPRYISGDLIHVSKGLRRKFSGEEKLEKYSTRKGRKYSVEESEKRNKNRKPAWNKGNSKKYFCTKETKILMFLKSNKEPKEKIICPYCNKIGGKPSMILWHFENCKEKIICV